MNQKHQTAQSGPSTSSGAWGLHYPGLVMGKGGKNEVKEFTGMWPLKPDADAVTTKLGLIRGAHWFVCRTQDFGGYTLFFVSQFDGSLDKYFDDFVLNGNDNLAAIWGQCVGCPTGPDASARDIVEYLAPPNPVPPGGLQVAELAKLIGG